MTEPTLPFMLVCPVDWTPRDRETKTKTWTKRSDRIARAEANPIDRATGVDRKGGADCHARMISEMI